MVARGGGRSDFVALWTVALGAMLLAIIWALICVATTALGARTTGMSLESAPLSTWGFLIFSLYGILTLPVAVGQLIISYLDVRAGYLTTADTTPLATVTDQLFNAPAVYWLAIPVLGMAVEIIAVHTNQPIRFRKAIMVAIGLLAVTAFAPENLSFLDRGVGSSRGVIDYTNGVLVLGLIASILPVLATLGLAGESLRKGSPVARSPLAAVLAAGLLLLAGMAAALLGVIEPVLGFFETISGEPIDVPDALQLNGTTFNAGVSALIIAGAVLGAIGGIQHWGHKMWGHTMDERVGMLAILSAVGGGLIWGLGEIIGGFGDQNALPGVSDSNDFANVIVLIGVAGVLTGLGFALVNAASGGVAGRGSMSEPWKGLTLEWLTESPPPFANFEGPIVVRSAYPLLDIAADEAAGESESAQDQDSTKSEVPA